MAPGAPPISLFSGLSQTFPSVKVSGYVCFLIFFFYSSTKLILYKLFCNLLLSLVTSPGNHSLLFSISLLVFFFFFFNFCPHSKALGPYFPDQGLSRAPCIRGSLNPWAARNVPLPQVLKQRYCMHVLCLDIKATANTLQLQISAKHCFVHLYFHTVDGITSE